MVHFWYCVFSFIFICRCFSFCWCCNFIWFLDYFAMSPALHPGFSDPSRSPPAVSFTPSTFDWLFFFIYRERYGFEWAFFTHRCFLPYAPSQHFWHIPDICGTFPTFWYNLLLSRFHWEPAVTFLKVAGLHTDPRNTHSAHLFVWFTVIHNLLCILSAYLCMSILQKFYLWWKFW